MATIDLGKIKLVWRGTYAGGTAYTVDDVVQHTDTITSSFICTTASTGNAPSTGGSVHSSWAYLAKGSAAFATLTTQGDILYRGASADARLAKGTASQQLAINAGATAPEWVTVAGGSILQMKTVQYGTYVNTTNTSLGTSAYDITGLTMVMTPTLATSHILITGQIPFGHYASYVGRGYLTYNHSGISETVVKANANSYGMTWRFDGTDSGDTRGLSATAVNIFLSPATANEITFKIKMMTSNSGHPSFINGDRDNTTNANDGGNEISSLTFWEIANSITPTLSNTGIAT